MKSIFTKINHGVKNFSLYRSFSSISSSILWYKTQEHGWITAKDYYLKTVNEEILTIIKHEVHGRYSNSARLH